MKNISTGKLEGTLIKLDEPIPSLDGRRVNLIIEPVEEAKLSDEENARFWEEWEEKGPQGPIEDARCPVQKGN